MQEQQRLERNRTRLTECYEVFAEALAGVIADMERLGFRPRIQDAWRSPEAQLAAFNSGNSELRFGFALPFKACAATAVDASIYFCQVLALIR